MDATGLTPKQALFVREYTVDMNGTRAAVRAGYSRETAESQASRLLRNVKVRKEIDAALAKRAARVEVTADEVLRELKRIALTDIRDAYEPDGHLKKMKDMPEDIARAIGGVDTEELWDGYGEERTRVGETVKVKFWPKVQALELLGKHLKLFTDKHEHSHSFDELTDEQLEARFRALVPQEAGPTESAVPTEGADPGLEGEVASRECPRCKEASMKRHPAGGWVCRLCGHTGEES